MLNEEAVEKNEKQMKCDICDESFDIPTKGFAPDRALVGLLDREINNLDLGDELFLRFLFIIVKKPYY